MNHFVTQKNGAAMRHLVTKINFTITLLLAGVFPALFYYSNNFKLVPFSSFSDLVILFIGIVLILYLIIFLFTKNSFRASIGTLACWLQFHLYGPIYDGLLSLDIIQMETYSFFPFYFILVILITRSVANLFRNQSEEMFSVVTLVLGFLVVFNIFPIVAIELEKQSTIEVTNSANRKLEKLSNQYLPDIYYLVFDEAVGFEAIRKYWNDNTIDEFVAFLQSNGFTVAEESHSGSTLTLREIAVRLNFQEYPIGDQHIDLYDKAIANNSAMAQLKKLGYSIIAYDERRHAWTTGSPLPADYLYESPPEKLVSEFEWMDDYKILVLRNTLLRPLVYKFPPNVAKHKNMIYYTVDNVVSSEVPSPKFVYVHLLIPHIPFIFTETGEVIVDVPEHNNWQRYFGNYKYFLKLSQRMIENILVQSDPQKPPVIIFQSDHGARNIDTSPYSGFLKDYPEEYKTLIINALFLPGCDHSQFSNDVDPINTFPIVFNCYFGADIPIMK